MDIYFGPMKTCSNFIKYDRETKERGKDSSYIFVQDFDKSLLFKDFDKADFEELKLTENGQICFDQWKFIGNKNLRKNL